tara:strand:+ start:146 stop:304 length:159 start_codon:yes stop_codon:yes gene_type:complete
MQTDEKKGGVVTYEGEAEGRSVGKECWRGVLERVLERSVGEEGVVVYMSMIT